MSESKKSKKGKKDRKVVKKQKLVKKDKKDKGKKDKKKEKSGASGRDDAESGKASKKGKKSKDKKEKKGKKDKKKSKVAASAKSEAEHDADFERADADSPTTDEILKIIQDVDLEGALRVDSFSLLNDAIINGLKLDITSAFQQFLEKRDVNLLTSQLMTSSEQIFKEFTESQFSKSECDELAKLRRARTRAY